MINLWNCSIVGNESEFQSPCNVQFRINTLKKVMNTIPPIAIS